MITFFQNGIRVSGLKRSRLTLLVFPDPQLQLMIQMGLLTPTTLSNGQLNHTYVYVGNNPMSFTDFWGLKSTSGQMGRVPDKGFNDGMDSSSCRLQCAFNPTNSLFTEGGSHALRSLGALGAAYGSRLNLAGTTLGGAIALNCMSQCRKDESPMCLNPNL